MEGEEGFESESFHLPIVQDGEVDTAQFTGTKVWLRRIHILVHTLKKLYLVTMLNLYSGRVKS